MLIRGDVDLEGVMIMGGGGDLGRVFLSWVVLVLGECSGQGCG